mmetsp:Transcript_122365/g.243580  ORF Transcript_122365/g.243580 Transcript_122365/m.243580 type:complete len:84 (+) Transcript_122365:1-252(+)
MLRYEFATILQVKEDMIGDVHIELIREDVDTFWRKPFQELYGIGSQCSGHKKPIQIDTCTVAVAPKATPPPPQFFARYLFARE